MIEEALEEARRLAHENRLEGKDLDELAELEDDEDQDFLEHYRYVCTMRGVRHHADLPGAQATKNFPFGVTGKSASKSYPP